MALIAAQEICNLHAPRPERPPIKHELLRTGFHDCDATVWQLQYPNAMTLSNEGESILFDWPVPDDF